jgi:hypothetical protein
MEVRELLDPPTASAYVGIAVQTLARWRVEGGGPTYIKIGSRVRYDRVDLDRWLNERRRRSTAETGVGDSA